MTRGSFVALVICLLVVSSSFSGCIESHHNRTETVLARYDRAGALRWTTVVENQDYATAQSLAPSNRFIETPDGGFLIAGFFTNASGTSIRLLKTDSSGNIEWEKRIPETTADQDILAIVRKADGTYAVFCRYGHVYNYDISGSIGSVKILSAQLSGRTVNESAGEEYPPFTIDSLAPGPDGVILLGHDYADIQKPFVLVRLSPDGTLLWKKVPDQQVASGTTSLIPARDGGFLFGKSRFVTEDGVTKILLLKTDRNTTRAWESAVGSCSSVPCNNDLLGMQESADGTFHVIYRSVETDASGGNHEVLREAWLDREGRPIRRDTISLMELPSWVFSEAAVSRELAGLMNETERDILVPMVRGTTFRVDALLKSGDGGFVLLGTRFS